MRTSMDRSIQTTKAILFSIVVTINIIFSF